MYREAGIIRVNQFTDKPRTQIMIANVQDVIMSKIRVVYIGQWLFQDRLILTGGFKIYASFSDFLNPSLNILFNFKHPYKSMSYEIK